MKKLVLLITLLCFLTTIPVITYAQKRRSTKTNKSKTVHVRSYKTKKGKQVKSHYRSKPTKRKYTYLFLEAIETKKNS